MGHVRMVVESTWKTTIIGLSCVSEPHIAEDIISLLWLFAIDVLTPIC